MNQLQFSNIVNTNIDLFKINCENYVNFMFRLTFIPFFIN